MKVNNIMTIDIEDWFMDLDISTWDSYESKIVESTNKILKILEDFNTNATFFVLGYVAEHFPELIKNIMDNGHEIASHGYNHIALTKQTPKEFEQDLLKAKKIIEHKTNNKIIGYRAPYFSINKDTSWALSILEKNGFKYDSSIFPIKTHLYGVKEAPLFPYHISSLNICKEDLSNNFFELPLTCYNIPFLRGNIPIAGGFYLRLFPYWFIDNYLKRVNKMNYPAICYIHPWEFYIEKKKIKELKFYHYYNLKSTEKKFKKLVKDFKFITAKEWISNV